ncbi:hypothetical protein [Mycobacterium sp. NAZ190054]|uniref:hypothetical protein n=1 Tax=Mycobacterium sp. NAZ190054 TaxID=1747766 RepID=UPI00083324AF|nr:hypothetical protein [Mycobacterium sp. NAZ190054]
MTTGVAVVGVGVIAVAPLEPSPAFTDVRVTNSAVDLTAAPNPFEYYPQVVMRSLANAGDRLREYLAAPLPIVDAVADNQYAALAVIGDAVGDEDVVAVLEAVVGALTTPVLNLAKVVGSGEPYRTAASVIVRLALPIASGVVAAGSGTVDVGEALLDLDVVGAFGAATNIPARIVDGFLNGRVDGVDDTYHGLLTPVVEAPVADQVTGPVAHLIDSLQEIGGTIAGPSAEGVGATELPNPGAGGAPGPRDEPTPTVPPPDDPAPPTGKPAAPSPPSPSADDDPSAAGEPGEEPGPDADDQQPAAGSQDGAGDEPDAPASDTAGEDSGDPAGEDDAGTAAADEPAGNSESGGAGSGE